MTALETFAAFLAGDFHPSSTAHANIQAHLTDTVGAWVVGAATAEGRALLAFQSNDEIDVGTPSALARLSEIDNIHMAAATTPGGIVIPAALILAASRGADGKALADAILAGIEAMVRLGRAIDGPQVIYRGIWPTYFGAPLGVAAVASRLLGLDARQTAHALALALTFAAPGVGHHNATTTSRWFAVAQAARNGLVAARAAQAGFTSDTNLLESGFLHGTFGITPSLEKFTGGLGKSFALDEAAFKPWCAARQTMAATQGLKEILADGVSPEQIKSIEVAVPPPYLKMTAHGVVPGDRASYLTSLPYHLAIAACDPDAEYDIGQTPASLSTDVQAFMGKVTVAADEALLAHYPTTWPARITVLSADKAHERLVLAVPGEPTRPLSGADLEAKFRRFVGNAAGAPAADGLLAACAGALGGPEAVACLVGQIEGLYPKPMAFV
jgi:2-methylcitrate dehydratase PrpD